MSETQGTSWAQTHSGEPPVTHWSFTTDAPLVDVSLARETDEVVLADESGGVYLLDRDGHVAAVTRGLKGLSKVAISDSGDSIAASHGRNRVSLLNRKLGVTKSIDLPDPVHGLALDPFGRNLAVALGNSQVRIVSTESGKLKTVAEFATIRPIAHIVFLATKPTLIEAAEYGLLCEHSLKGKALWDEKLWSNIGAIGVSGSGSLIATAAFAHGIQLFGRGGRNRGALQIEGTPHRVAVTYDGRYIIATTLERHIYRLTTKGKVIWTGLAPREVKFLRADAFGHSIVCGTEGGRVARLAWTPLGPQDSDDFTGGDA
ncbi:hypothetical protein [Stratiformator vulcanicus]|uniref:WD domain, G-beta repeat n=1 Tax=Stratiformator vulcanicus TaxID=2527980 RepID=A0A517QVY6_9PLAN|nr:hypothetical protein [Stratiformator vulcanicus]QDT35825.1 hypothetical protein Pan189_01780 [Stratiformator vulcanicus]